MKGEIQSRLNLLYRAEAELGELVKDMLEEEQAIDILAPVASTSDAPLVRYVNLLLNQAISDSASDIHVEPSENNIRIRFRIDGVLKEMAPAPEGDPVRRHLAPQDHERHGHRRAPGPAGRPPVGRVARAARSTSA